MRKKAFLLVGAICWLLAGSAAAQNDEKQAVPASMQKINNTTVEVIFSDGGRRIVDFYGERIFRLFEDPAGGVLRDPVAEPPAQMLVDRPRSEVGEVKIDIAEGNITVRTAAVAVRFDRKSGLMQVEDLASGRVVIEEAEPVRFDTCQTTLTLRARPDEYFFGGGVQNGRFSHRGRIIAIENQNSWTDGGVCSPAPFYWSTGGYGIFWHTFKKGEYDFGATDAGLTVLRHRTPWLDLFCMVDEGCVPLLNDYYQLTGHPVLLPKFGFYEGHLNAYNRDCWREDPAGILFEDGKRYKEGKQADGGVRESLNGETGNYLFSARAVVDRYERHDMPLGWVLPNDGYGAGYGQTETLDGNIRNLKEFGDYAREHGVEIGLWTQSDLHPKEGVSALLQRDIVKEVRDAGVRVLKTDVAWVGAGYSFGLNGVADVAQVMPYYGSDARPFIISLDGWAGTQRYAGIWSGDQTGGEWEYIRFHIPTYIGSGLAGQPNISSDMDGIFGGGNAAVNVRDFQWKTFTPMQLNMDGWGANEKYPHALGEPAASINRWYLKLKAQLLPYTYTIAREAVDGLPMIRAMMLAEPNAFTLGTATRYQFLYGNDLLVAPIYRATCPDAEGNDRRDGIYLPEGVWIDYFTGERYAGGAVINNYEAPLWKLPVFVRSGAIIPMTVPHNNVTEIPADLRIYDLYPDGKSHFTEYDDDGRTEAWRRNACATTRIETSLDEQNTLTVTIHPTEGGFEGFQPRKRTELWINTITAPRNITAEVGGRRIKLTPRNTASAYADAVEGFYFDAEPELNRFATPDSEFAEVKIAGAPKLRIKLPAANVTTDAVNVIVEGYTPSPSDPFRLTMGALGAPDPAVAAPGPYTLTPSWHPVDTADFYEIDFDGMRYTTIRDTALLFEDLRPETDYTFRVRAVNAESASAWAECKATTLADPLQFAIRGIGARSSAPAQDGAGTDRLFDFDESDNLWHTKYGETAVPFDLTIDLGTVNRLDKLHYLPRSNAGNGNILRGTAAWSMDCKQWHEAGEFAWEHSAEVKIFTFDGQPMARYVRLHVTEAVGGFGSGREIYLFKVPGSESYLQGDINSDGRIDRNDLTSYMNYTGLRTGDPDFEGYVSRGDVNGNGLIDAYDISIVGTQLDGGVEASETCALGGQLELTPSAKSCEAGQIVELRLRGKGMQGVNAFSAAITYDPQAFEFAGVEAVAAKEMENLTIDRLHSSGTQSLYPTFVNLGERPTLEGDQDLCILRLKAKRQTAVDLQMTDPLIVDKSLNTLP